MVVVLENLVVCDLRRTAEGVRGCPVAVDPAQKRAIGNDAARHWRHVHVDLLGGVAAHAEKGAARLRIGAVGICVALPEPVGNIYTGIDRHTWRAGVAVSGE
jgi:hypothetical protein